MLGLASIQYSKFIHDPTSMLPLKNVTPENKNIYDQFVFIVAVIVAYSYPLYIIYFCITAIISALSYT